jgi:hypothetical protein
MFKDEKNVQPLKIFYLEIIDMQPYQEPGVQQ